MSLPTRRFVRFDALRFRRFRHLLVPARAGGLLLALALAGGLLPAPAQAVVENVRVDRVAFSPNGDGVRDDVRFTWNTTTPTESLIVVIRRSTQGAAGPYVRKVSYGPQPAMAYEFLWDGTDSTGAAVVETQYTAQVVELTAAGHAVTGSAGFAATLLDNAPPPAPTFADGTDGHDTTSVEIPISGFAPGSDSVIVFTGGVPTDTVRVSGPDSAFAATVRLNPGANSIAAQGYDRAGNLSILSTAVTVHFRNTSDITLLTPRPFEVSPNGDGVLDTARVQLRIDAPTTRLTVQVRPAVPYLTGTLPDTTWIVRLYDGPIAAVDTLFEWDGKDSTGADVPDGSWFFFAQVESIDVALNPRPGVARTARFVLDRVAPSIPVAEPPPPARTTHNSIVLTGVPTGTAQVADTTIVYEGDDVVGRANGVARWNITAPLTLGSNTFTFQAADRAGNRSAIGNPVTVVYEEVLGFHAPERFRANDVFEVNVSRPARSVVIELFDLGGRLVRHLSVTRTDVRYELAWNLLDDFGATVGNGPYVARTTVSYVDGGVETRKGAIVVAK